jgi:drug/metabolite transporter (DMT)-like permease
MSKAGKRKQSGAVRVGPSYALLAAALFGASTPVAKLLLGEISPVLLAGVLYAGSGLALSAWLWGRRMLRNARTGREPKLRRSELGWLGGAVLSGGVVAPVLLMIGLSNVPASTASLLLNMEGVLTACLAWFVFHENYDRRIALGMLAITAGGILLAWSGRPQWTSLWPQLAVLGACLGWAIDNNLTRKVSAADPVQTAAIKGLCGGLVNVGLALALGARLPALSSLSGAASVGVLGYGVSLVLFILALRHLGSARTGAYFSTAPFIGATVSLVLIREPLTPWLIVAGGLMGIGVWLHLSERHEHQHAHDELDHDHLHHHDEHHQHGHASTHPPGEPHSHAHHHEPMVHTHAHYPDIHHRHKHGNQERG